MLTPTDPLLLAEARVIARIEVNNLATRLGQPRIVVYRTPEEIEVGSRRLREQIQRVSFGMSAVRDAAMRAAVEYRALERIAMAAATPRPTVIATTY